MNHLPDGPTTPSQSRLNSLIDQIIDIADSVTDKEQVATAKLKIEARQWVVEKCLMKEAAKREKDAGSEPISVTINAGSDTP